MSNGTVIDEFVSLAQCYGRQPALDQGGKQISYSELLERAARTAEHLSKIGVRAKDVVAICGVPSCGLYSSILGVLLARAVMLLIDPRLPRERTRFMMNESGCRLLVLSGSMRIELPAWPTLEIDPASATIRNVRVNDPPIHFFSRCQEYEFPAYIFCTSGTTAQPRLVLGSHRGLAHFIHWQRETFQVGVGDRVAQLTGLSFDVVLRDIFLPLTSGGTLCIPEETHPLAPSAVLSWLQTARISRLHTVPTVAQSWLSLSSAGTSLPLMRTVFFAGEPLTDVLVRRWREHVSSQCEIVNLYGPTETTLAKFFCRIPDEGMKEGIQPVGSSLPECELCILNEKLQECGPEVAGQIAIATQYGSYGYLNAPEESARRFRLVQLKNGRRTRVFLTGDLGKLSSQGQLHILGRMDHQIKINGIRVEPEEISALAARHPGIASAVTIAFEANSAGTKRLCLYWVANGIVGAPSTRTLRQFLAKHLHRDVIPSIFIKLESLPVTPNGKVDRSMLPTPKLSSAGLAAKTDTERQLLPIWKKILEASGGIPGADFFSSGGTSLSLVELQLKIEATLGISIPAADIFKNPSFRDVARLIAQAQRKNFKLRIPPAPSLEEYPLLPSQRAYLRFQFDDGDHTWNNVSTVLRFKSTLSVNIMEQAFAFLVQRHQNLRLTFHRRGTHWIQKPTPGNAIPLRELDLRQMPLGEQQLALAQAQKQQGKVILQPDKWPLFVATLVHINESDTRLIFTTSHLISDALSHEIIAKELNECIRCLQEGIVISLPKLEIEFLDYVMWRLGQPELNPRRESLNYWLEMFSDYRDRLELQFDGDSAAGAAAAGYKRWIANTLSEQVWCLSAEMNCSGFVVLLTAFALSLHRLSGRNSIVLKTVADGRPYPFLRQWVGNFATAVHVRSEIRNDTTFLEFTKAIQNGVSAAVKHQECEFLEVLESLGVSIETDRIPLASIFLNPAGRSSGAPPSNREESCEDLSHELKPDIMAYVRQIESPIELEVHYRKGLYSCQTIRKLMDCFEETLAEMTFAPGNKIVVAKEAVA